MCGSTTGPSSTQGHSNLTTVLHTSTLQEIHQERDLLLWLSFPQPLPGNCTAMSGSLRGNFFPRSGFLVLSKTKILWICTSHPEPPRSQVCIPILLHKWWESFEGLGCSRNLKKKKRKILFWEIFSQKSYYFRDEVIFRNDYNLCSLSPSIYTDVRYAMTLFKPVIVSLTFLAQQ